MEENINNKKGETSSIVKIGICLALLLAVFLPIKEFFVGSSNKVLAYSDEECRYLSDIPYQSAKVGWGSVTLDQNLDTKYNNGLITLIMEDGTQKSFRKGVAAHAESTLIYDISSYNLDHFTAYIGVDASRGANGTGVKFSIYTSVDGENWDLKTQVSPPVMRGNTKAQFVDIDIKGAKYLKLYANSNGNIDADHSVYADAKLIKEGFVLEEKEIDFIKTVEEYDEILRNKAPEDIVSNNELILLQREFVKNAGYDNLIYIAQKDDIEETLRWLMTDLENLELYMLGGYPDGKNYQKSINILKDLYKTYKDDFEITETTKYGTVYGDLYKRMAITLSLTHSVDVYLWMQSSPENRSDAVRRYQIYKDLHKNGNMQYTSTIDFAEWFEKYTIEEMRYVMNCIIDDQEILWLNEYTQSFIDANPGNPNWYLSPHPYMAYLWPNYGRPEYYNAANKEKYDVKYKGIFSKYGVEFGKPGVNKLWMNIEGGAVCGGISKQGACNRGVHGVPATVVCQPGHAAFAYYTMNANGDGFWTLNNVITNWGQTGKTERMNVRMPLGWGSDSYVSGWAASYLLIAQAAMNQNEAYEASEKIIMTADIYDDLGKKEEIYRAALKELPYNIDAWVGLINVYNETGTKTEEDYYKLAEEIAENLRCYPLPMYHLTNLIKPKLTSSTYSAQFVILQKRILEYAKALPNSSTETYQPSVAREVSTFLLGQMNTNVATFSFDGEDAGKIVLSSSFNEMGIRWDYCINGDTQNPDSWKEHFFEAGEEHKWQLTQEEIDSITDENDIYVHLVGVNYDEKNLYKIDILESAGLPSTLYASDLENRVLDVNLNTEWRYTENDDWTRYSKSSPDLTGDKTIQLRQSATGTRLASKNPVTFTFTQDTDPDTRKYIPVSHLNIVEVSSEAVNNNGAARYAIDANLNTRYHSAWNGTDTKRYIIIKLDKSVVLSAVEFVPAGGGNGKILDGTIYGSMDGENWTVLASRKNIRYTNKADTIEQAKANTQKFEIADPQEVQYVKIVADNASTGNNMARNGNWFTARAFNFYQDLTKNPHPTAGIGYSTTEKTNQAVIARLINPSTNITITNNDGKDSYVFTENGEFTFEFEDEKGRTGKATAKVDWIDKNGPSADVNYKLGDDKKLIAILDNISEDVYLLDNNNNKINYIEVADGKVKSISFLDETGEVYKISELDENRITKRITYKNTTGKVERVKEYVITIENGEIVKREGIDEDKNIITLENNEIEELKVLEGLRSNPLEFYLEKNEEYEFKFLDKASNITIKNVRVDYIENDTKILASDITYNTTMATKDDVVATIKPYIIDINGKNGDVELINNGGKDTYTFTENGEFIFEYAEKIKEENQLMEITSWLQTENSGDSDEENPQREFATHTARVNWIDKIAPTAEISYSTQEATNKPVVATLVNESEAITITNNGGSKEHTFTENGEFTFEFVDKAGNEGIAVAKVNWIEKKEEPGEDPIFRSDKYKIEENEISRIEEETTVAKFKENIETNQEIIFKDKDGNTLSEDGIITTGSTIQVGENSNFVLIVTGDINGDGLVTVTDLAQLKLHYISKELIEDNIRIKAADMNEDGNITITDLAQIKIKLVSK